MQIQNLQNSVYPIKSPNDSRIYEGLTLKNSLKILLIQDPTLEKSACSISVGIGSLQDPERSLGLAHFLEHMLFMGSRKFPEYNQYSTFINQNSGMDNAYTDDLQTNFHFQISNQSFPQAVERMVNFFAAALLTESCIKKQTQAVHEEYVLWKNDDHCRKWEILKILAQRPYSRFSIGNNQTLAHPEIRNDLVNFYESYYSANRIKAVLCSNMSIEEMKKQLVPYFYQIPNKNIPQPHYNTPFKTQNLGKFVRMQSIKQQTYIQFFLPVQSLKHAYKKHIVDYIKHILSHQGQNSLYSYLERKSYASYLQCFAYNITGHTIFNLAINLTEEGYSNYQQIYNTVIDYICSLKPDKELFEEIKQKKAALFQFKEKQKNINYVCDLSSKMHYIPLEEVLSSEYLFEDFDGIFLERVLKQLNPFNLIAILSNENELKNPITEKYFGVKYVVEQLPQRKLFVNNFKSLIKNPFLPLDISVKPFNNYKQIPTKIHHNITFLKDNTFKVCKGGVNIAMLGMNHPVLREFYCSYLKFLLQQISYDAETLQTSIQYKCDDAVQIQIFGFSDTALKLVDKIGEKIIALHQSNLSEKLFRLSLDQLIQAYENFYCEEVNQICQGILTNLLINEYCDVDQTINILEDYSYENESKKFLQFLTNCTLSWIFVGNFDEEECKRLASNFQKNIKTNSNSKDSEIKCLRIDSPIKYLKVLDSDEISTSGSVVYYSAGIYNEKLFYILNLLKNYIEQPFFDELRTQKQLAYYLNTDIVHKRGVLGISFTLVSSSRDSEFISKEIQKFVQKYMDKMDVHLTQEKLNQIKQSVKIKFSVLHNNLKELFEFVCSEISQSTFYFNRKSKEELDLYLNSIQKADLIQTWETISSKFLDVQILAKNHQEQFNRLNDLQDYLTFQKIKKGNYYQDIITEKKRNNSY